MDHGFVMYGGLLCSQCGRPLRLVTQKRYSLEPMVVECSNMNCAEYEKRYTFERPRVELKPAD